MKTLLMKKVVAVVDLAEGFRLGASASRLPTRASVLRSPYLHNFEITCGLAWIMSPNE